MRAEIEILDGNADDASSRARESLAAYTELEDDRSRARCLVVLAAAAVAEGSYEAAARILGAAGTEAEEASLDEYEEPILERYVPVLEAHLGANAVRALEAEGRGLGERALEPAIVTPDTGA